MSTISLISQPNNWIWLERGSQHHDIDVGNLFVFWLDSTAPLYLNAFFILNLAQSSCILDFFAHSFFCLLLLFILLYLFCVYICRGCCCDCGGCCRRGGDDDGRRRILSKYFEFI